MFRRSDESIISIQSNPFVNHGSHERQDPNQRRDRNAQHSVFAVFEESNAVNAARLDDHRHGSHSVDSFAANEGSIRFV